MGISDYLSASELALLALSNLNADIVLILQQEVNCYLKRHSELFGYSVYEGQTLLTVNHV